jgi:hypothetical protein
MDITKFLSILTTESLFFTRADRFEDKWEGALTRNNLKKWERRLVEGGLAEPENAMSVLRESFREQRQHTYICCWHLGEHESAAMWKLYVKGFEGVALRTTTSGLTGALARYPDHDIFVGKVTYLDYDKEILPDNGLLAPLLCKRKSFEHEHEARAVISARPPTTLQDLVKAVPPKAPVADRGLSVPVDLVELAAVVYVAPTAPKWVCVLVKDLVRKFAVAWKVEQSTLDDPAIS